MSKIERIDECLMEPKPASVRCWQRWKHKDSPAILRVEDVRGLLAYFVGGECRVANELLSDEKWEYRGSSTRCDICESSKASWNEHPDWRMCSRLGHNVRPDDWCDAFSLKPQREEPGELHVHQQNVGPPVVKSIHDNVVRFSFDGLFSKDTDGHAIPKYAEGQPHYEKPLHLARGQRWRTAQGEVFVLETIGVHVGGLTAFDSLRRPFGHCNELLDDPAWTYLGMEPKEPEADGTTGQDGWRKRYEHQREQNGDLFEKLVIWEKERELLRKKLQVAVDDHGDVSTMELLDMLIEDVDSEHDRAEEAEKKIAEMQKRVEEVKHSARRCVTFSDALNGQRYQCGLRKDHIGDHVEDLGRMSWSNEQAPKEPREVRGSYAVLAARLQNFKALCEELQDRLSRIREVAK